MTVTSARVKSVLGSLRMKLSVAVWLAARLALSMLTWTLGASRSGVTGLVLRVS